MSCDVPYELNNALGHKPVEVLASSRDYFIVFADQDTVKSLAADMAILKNIGKFGYIITAPDKEVDFVSRFFAPGEGIPEDPVTGSAHCTLIPYWSKRLHKTEMVARQLSRRGGVLLLSGCRRAGKDRRQSSYFYAR